MPNNKRYILFCILLAGGIFFLLLMDIFSKDFSSDSENTISFNSQSSFDYSSDYQTSSFYYQYDSKYDSERYSVLSQQYDDVILQKNYGGETDYNLQTLFIGDSNTAGLSSFGYLPLQNVLAKPSMAIQSVKTKKFVYFKSNSQSYTIVESVALLKPRRIIINFGTNNTVGTSCEDFIKIYKSVLHEISVAYRYADIIVAAILPVGKTRDNIYIKMQTIDSFNLALMEMCKQEGYKFLNTAEIFKDPDTGFMQAKYVASDGIHLNNSGFLTFLEYVDTHRYITQDRRPPRGFIPTRVLSPSVSDTPSFEMPNEPGSEDVIRPPMPPQSSAQSSDISSSSSISSEITPDSIPSSSNIASSENSEIVDDNSHFEEDIIYDPFL